jgi:riboflavin kinase/FMN adenylyltransferase
MQVFRGLRHPGIAPACALTIGNFDGVHRGHQAMLALLTNEARHRGVPSCVLSFEPHPRDYFGRRAGRADQAPRRVATLRDKLSELERCGIDQAVIMRFDARFAGQTPQAFIDDVLVRGLHARYVLVGDDFRFGARRAGDYAMLDGAGADRGFDVARMMSYEVHGLRVSSSAVRQSLADGDMAQATTLLGRPYSVSGHVLHGRKLGRELGTPTLNLRFGHARPAAQGVFAVQVHGLCDDALPGVASLGVRPTVEDGGRQLLEVHCLRWPEALGREGAYGSCVKVELLHKFHDERKYPSMAALRQGIDQDIADARAWFGAQPPAR